MAFTGADMIVRVGADIADFTRGMGQVGDSVNRGGAAVGRASLLMGGAAVGIVGGFGMAINSAMDFEGAMADVSASLGTTGAEFDQLSALALQIGSDTSFSATQGANAIEALGKAGMSVTDILQGAGMATAQLAEATGSDLATSADVMSNSMNAFQLSGDQAVATADTMTAALNESSLSLNDFQMGMASAGTIANSVGLSFEQTSAALALFSNRGMSGADAGTSLRTMLTALAGPTEEAQAWFDKMGLSMQEGIESGDLLGYTADKLRVGLGEMGEADRLAALKIMFGADAQRVANILFEEGSEGIGAMTEKMQANGQAAEAQQRRMAGLRGAMEQLKGSVETAFIMFGSMLTPALTATAKVITGLVNRIAALPRPAKAFIGILAGGVAAITAIGAALGLIMTLPVGAGLGALAAGFSAILAPVALLIAAGYLLYRGWQSNFGGMRDAITPVIDMVSRFGSMFLKFADDIFGTGRRIQDVIFAFPAPLREVARGLLLIVDAAGDLYRAFSSGGLSGLLDALPAAFSQVGRAALLLGGELLSGIMGAFSSIDWGAALAALGDLAGALAGWLWGQASSVDWAGLLSDAASMAGDITGDILTGLGDLGTSLAGWLSTEAGQVDWGGILSGAATRAGEIASDIAQGLGDLTGALSSWLGEQAGRVDWGGLLKSAAGTAGDITGAITSGLGDLGARLKGWYDSAIQSVNWAGLGETAGQAVRGGAEALYGVGRELITGLGTAISNADWGSIARGIGVAILALPATIGYVGLTLAPKALELLQGFVDGLDINWPLIGGWLISLPMKIAMVAFSLNTTLLAKGVELIQGMIDGLTQHWPTMAAWLLMLPVLALAAVPSMLMTLLSKGVELIQGVITGLTQHVPTMVAWLRLLGQVAFAAVGSLAATLLARGVELIRGAVSGLNQAVPTFTAWLKQVGPIAYSAVGNLFETLLSRGEELITGLYDGADVIWGDMWSWLTGLPGQMAGALGNLGGLLVGAGNALMDGLYNGIAAGWERVKGLLSSLDPSKHKGPPERDRQMLIGNGLLTMAGYEEGLTRGWSGVQRTLQHMTPTLPGADVYGSPIATATGAALAGSGGGGGAITYIDNRSFTVDVDSLPDVARAVNVINDLQQDFEVVYGGTG